MTAEEFHSALQEATNFPLRGFVLPYLKHTLPSLQRDLSNAARASNQVTFTLASGIYFTEFVHSRSRSVALLWFMYALSSTRPLLLVSAVSPSFPRIKGGF